MTKQASQHYGSCDAPRSKPFSRQTRWSLRARQNIIAGLVCSEGEVLSRFLRNAGISTTRENSQGGHFDLDKLEFYLTQHCVVIEGHLADRCWPRVRRKLQQPVPGKLCSCYEFLMHADCEHIVFIKAICGDQGFNLSNIPQLRWPRKVANAKVRRPKPRLPKGLRQRQKPRISNSDAPECCDASSEVRLCLPLGSQAGRS